MSEIRHNRLTGEWVIIAPERAKRGSNLASVAPPAEIPAYDAACPFCPGNKTVADGERGERYRCAGADGRWLIRSVVNKFSVLSPTGEVASPGCAGKDEETVNGIGLHEVLIEAPQHNAVMALFPVGQVERVLAAYLDRFRAFYADPRIRHVIVFKNHGADAGASQQHAHSQIVGIPIVPGQVVDRLERARRFLVETGQCLVCSLIAEEPGSRVIAENGQFVALLPYAALSPYHLWIFPKVHAASFSELPEEALPALAEILHTVLAKIHGLLANPAFNLVIRSLGPAERDAEHFHWYISIVPRVNRSAGFELGTGMYVNPSSPEVCAEALRTYSPGA
jgi:UDPglucose--hexose-1-phosphate uridylyltransferase